MLKNLCYILSVFIFLLIMTACSENKTGDNNAEDALKTEETLESQEKTKDVASSDSSDEGSKEGNKKVNEVLKNTPLLPTDEAGFVKQNPGKFANKVIWDVEEEVKQELKKLPPMSENSTEQELKKYLSYMYWLVAEDFPNPADVVKKWEFASFGNPNLPDARYHFKENYNVEIILDASGSMAADVNGKTRMQLAKETINNFLKSIPEKANVSLRVYGHKGSGSDSDKEMSCGAIEQVYGFAPYVEAKFQKALNQFNPSGWTPIAAALKQSKNALKQFDTKTNTNLIYLVSDGIGTCDGNPVEVAESLSKSNAKPIINIIGFGADAKAQSQLQKMAEVSGGIYSTVNDQRGLAEEFERAEEVLEAWEDWKEDAIEDLDMVGVHNSFDIMKITNDWSSISTSQSNNLVKVIGIAQDLGIITIDQRSTLSSMENDVVDRIDKIKDNIENRLENISIENIEKLKKSINEKYNKQTQN
ncbi:VWA domain-containing protein [Virgibacillus kekensis]|uniref:VWA domain-containing protein n=1 Tax=Virgibacillus kekensis TaxID=202261 RepID=A0ABV9DJZ1_9BACI